MNHGLVSYAAEINVESVSSKYRGLVKGAQIVAIPPHVTKTARGFVRVLEGWYTRRIENGFAFCNIVAAHPTRENRFSRESLKFLSAFVNSRSIRHRLSS